MREGADLCPSADDSLRHPYCSYSSPRSMSGPFGCTRGYRATTRAGVATIRDHGDREDMLMMPIRGGVRLDALAPFPKGQPMMLL